VIYAWAAAAEVAVLMSIFLFGLPPLALLFTAAVVGSAVAAGIAIGYRRGPKMGFPAKEDEMSRDILHRSTHYAFVISMPQLLAAWIVVEIAEMHTDVDVAWVAKTMLQVILMLLVMTWIVSYIVLNKRMQTEK